MIIIFLARFAMSMHLKEILLFILVCFIVILRFGIFLVLISFEIQLWKLRFFVKCCFRFVRGVLRWGFGGGEEVCLFGFQYCEQVFFYLGILFFCGCLDLLVQFLLDLLKIYIYLLFDVILIQFQRLVYFFPDFALKLS